MSPNQWVHLQTDEKIVALEVGQKTLINFNWPGFYANDLRVMEEVLNQDHGKRFKVIGLNNSTRPSSITQFLSAEVMRTD